MSNVQKWGLLGVKVLLTLAFVAAGLAKLSGQEMMVATYDASSGGGRLFQDGVLVGTGNSSPNDDASLQIGAFASANFFQGLIAEVIATRPSIQ